MIIFKILPCKIKKYYLYFKITFINFFILVYVISLITRGSSVYIFIHAATSWRAWISLKRKFYLRLLLNFSLPNLPILLSLELLLSLRFSYSELLSERYFSFFKFLIKTNFNTLTNFWSAFFKRFPSFDPPFSLNWNYLLFILLILS